MSGSNSSARIDAPPANPDPVALTIHSMPLPDAAVFERRTRAGRLKMLLVLAICAAPVIASYLMYYVVQPQGRTNYSELILPTRGLPVALALRSLDGVPVAAPSLAGQWLLVAIGPSACADACERVLYLQRQMRTMLGRDRDRLDKVWFVTDDAPIAPTLRDALGGPEPVTALRASRDALSTWLLPASGQALEDHLYVIDPMGEWMMRVPANPDPSKVKRDLERLMRASASWDKAGR
jgi:hypothetical protein